ncbi:MAG: hypothetical protein OEZ16_01840 [Chromatiales bacterium]|nr:hypothetical protein [Chromatiales bacterium]
MIKLVQSASQWGSQPFRDTFKHEVEQLRAEQLPLQQGLALSSYVSAEPFKVMVIDERKEGDNIIVKAGVFYSGIIAGCSCADDPTPTDVQTEYCDLQFLINRVSGETDVTLLQE